MVGLGFGGTESRAPQLGTKEQSCTGRAGQPYRCWPAPCSRRSAPPAAPAAICRGDNKQGGRCVPARAMPATVTLQPYRYGTGRGTPPNPRSFSLPTRDLQSCTQQGWPASGCVCQLAAAALLRCRGSNGSSTRLAPARCAAHVGAEARAQLPLLPAAPAAAAAAPAARWARSTAPSRRTPSWISSSEA